MRGEGGGEEGGPETARVRQGSWHLQTVADTTLGP